MTILHLGTGQPAPSQIIQHENTEEVPSNSQTSIQLLNDNDDCTTCGNDAGTTHGEDAQNTQNGNNTSGPEVIQIHAEANNGMFHLT